MWPCTVGENPCCTPTIVEVIYHVYKNNYGRDLEMMKELCDDLGFTFASCYTNITPVERLIDYCEGRVDNKTSKIFDLVMVPVADALEITMDYRKPPCRFLTNQVNINWDRSVALCCVCFDRNTSTISDDYLKDSFEEISARKHHHKQCRACMKLGIPPYLLGVNQKGWDEVARRTRKEIEEDPEP